MLGRAKRLYVGTRDTALQAWQRGQANGFTSAAVLVRTRFNRAMTRVADRIVKNNVECPCCGWTGSAFRTLDCGQFLVKQVECPNCHGHERHRLIHAFLQRRPPHWLSEGSSILHFAAEEHIRRFLRPIKNLKRTETDYARHMVLFSDAPRLQSDIHHLPFDNATFNGIFCLHVLEHVKSDVDAIQELYRVLRPGGGAIIMVPFMMHQTETEEYGEPDPMIFDHVRGYSPLDFKHRLAPFEYEEIMPRTIFSEAELARYKVPDSQVLYLCSKPA